MEERIEMRITIQPYTTGELAPYFRRSERAFRRELAKIKHKYGPRLGIRWSRDQVRAIVEDFGGPYDWIIIEHKEIA